MRRKKTDFGISAIMNKFSYNLYLDRLSEIALTSFDWVNLPDTVNPRFLELILFSEGQILYFRDEIVGDLTLQFSTSGKLDFYRNPTKRRAIADNGYTNNLDQYNSVIIYNNYMRIPTAPIMEYYAMRLWDYDNIIAVNANAQKTPVLLQCAEEQRPTVANLYKEYDGNAPVIYGDKNLDLNAIKAISTGAPFVADKIYNIKMKIWNEALTTLGVNYNIEKKERLVTDEVNASQGATNAMKNTRLKARKEACKKINEMFNLNIDVKPAEGVNLDPPFIEDLPENEVTANE